MVKAKGLGSKLNELLENPEDSLMLEPPPFDQVIQNQPFY